MILLDTHAWIWFLAEPKQLSKRAAKVIDQGIGDRSIYVSAISAWELYQKAHRGTLVLDRPATEWVAQARMLPFISFVDIDESILRDSVFLPGKFHADPADRIIVATARLKGCPVVTKDRKIRVYPHVDSIW